MFNLAFAIPAVSQEIITVSQHTGSYNSSGVWSSTLTGTVAGTASIQPLTGIEIQRVPENLRGESMVGIWFAQALNTAGETPGIPGDRFTWHGDLYEIQGKLDWSDVGNYYKYFARKVVV